MTEFKLAVETKGITEPYLIWEVHAVERNVDNIEECIHDIVNRIATPKAGTKPQGSEPQKVCKPTSE